ARDAERPRTPLSLSYGGRVTARFDSGPDLSVDFPPFAPLKPVSPPAAGGVPPAVTGPTRAMSFATGDSLGKSLISNEVGSPATAREGSKTTPGSSRSPHRVVMASTLAPPGSDRISILP